MRREMRHAALHTREALSAERHAELSVALCAHLLPLVESLAPATLGFCWPYRAEPDLREFVTGWLDAVPARRAALPVVRAPDAPLAFLRWMPETAMRTDVYGIPVPAINETVLPDVVLIPLNAFDAHGYRLGYGGGFFDRTLAAMSPQPITIGVGFELGRVESILPEPHDRPLDWIVTEAGAFRAC